MSLSSEVLTSFSKDSLMDITNSAHIEVENRPTKANLVNTITDTVQENAVKYLIKNLKKTHLTSIRDKITDIDFTSKETNNPSSKTVMIARITDHVCSCGIEEFFSEHSKEIAVAVLVKLGYVQEDLKKKSKDDLVEMIVGESDLLGLQLLFQRLPTPMLKYLAEDELDLEIQTTNKSLITDAIINNEDVIRKVTKPKKARVYKKKPALVKGVKYEPIFQTYFRDELAEICAENGLSSSGRKKNLIESILELIADGEKVVMPGTKKAKKPAKKTNKRKAAKSPAKSKKRRRVSEEEQPESASEDEEESEEEEASASVDEEDVEMSDAEEVEAEEAEDKEEEAVDEESAADEESGDEDEELNLDGKTICLSGAFEIDGEAIKRDRIVGILTEFGATVAKSMSKKVDMLIVADMDNLTTSKPAFAKKHDIAIRGPEVIEAILDAEGDEE